MTKVNMTRDMRRRLQYKVTDEDGRAEKKWEGDLIQQTDSTVTPLVQH
jgi:hypothetical protein